MIYWRIYGFFLNPLKQVTKCCKMFTILADTFPSVLDDHERGTLYEELRRYDVWDPPAHIETSFEHDNDSGIMISIRISADQYWQKVSHVKTGDELGFRVLAKLSTAMLCIPHGNADSEQIFPQFALTVNFNVKEACYSFTPIKQMLQKARHPRQDEYKQSDSDFEVEN